MYGVETRALKQAVKRNIDRFPEDFMFEMTIEEAEKSFKITICDLEKGTKYKIRMKHLNRECLL